jgi:hypothetical protein
MNPNMALLILSWQVACLYHENETDKLLPGSASATQAESDALDKIHDELTRMCLGTILTIPMPVFRRQKIALAPVSKL